MQLIFIIVANVIHAHIIVADSKSDSIIVNNFIADFSFTDVTSIVFLLSDWQRFHQQIPVYQPFDLPGQ